MSKRKIVKKPVASKASLQKSDAAVPAIKVTGAMTAVVRAGTRFAGVHFRTDSKIAPPDGGYVAGTDYAVHVVRGKPLARPLTSANPGRFVLGGFHVAPGGNAGGKSGGDAKPAINPCSAWDRGFRPACRDPRGMTLVEGPHGPFWADIYLLAQDHLSHGTSRMGATIADGNSLPEKPAGGAFTRFDFATASEVMQHHGKQLLGAEEFFAAAIGVTERSAAGKDPCVTACDPARTSKFGLMQATGNMWVWGTDGHPHDPRPSFFGGSWIYGSRAGSRCADLGFWPVYSIDGLGARGRSDHLQLARPPRQRRR
jgi:hypothetical protein